jgi:hypothetical protein
MVLHLRFFGGNFPPKHCIIFQAQQSAYDGAPFFTDPVQTVKATEQVTAPRTTENSILAMLPPSIPTLTSGPPSKLATIV